MLIDPDIYSKKERTNIAIGVYLRPLSQSLSSYQSRKTRGKIFPCSLLLRECMLLCYLLKKILDQIAEDITLNCYKCSFTIIYFRDAPLLWTQSPLL